MGIKDKIFDMMRSRKVNKIHLNYLIDLGDECYDGEIIPITCDTIELDDDEIIIYDSSMENEDGSVDDWDKYRFESLDEGQQKEILWSLKSTYVKKLLKLVNKLNKVIDLFV